MFSIALLRRLVAVGMAAGLLTVIACGSSEEAAAPAATATPTSLPALPTVAVAAPAATPTPKPEAPAADKAVYGGRIGKSETNITIFDPHNSRAGYGLQLGMVGNLFSQLVRVPLDTRTGVEGDLAESWTISADGSEYTFNVRDGVVDHDGDPLTADDIYANMVRYVERPNGVSVRRQGCVRNYVNSILDDNGKTEASPGAQVLSDDSIVIRLAGPRAAFIPCMTGGFVMFHADTYIKGIDADAGGENRDLDPAKGELGGEFGPFKFSSVEINNFFKVDKNPNYYRDGLPYLDGIDIYEVPDETARVAAFKTGRIDISCTWVCFSKANVESIEKDVPGTVTPALVAIGYRSYQINTRNAPFGPVGNPDADNLRKAINLAVSRDVVNKLAFDGIGFLSPPYYIGWDWIHTEDEWRAHEGYARAGAKKDAEIAEAKKIMEGLGYGPNNRLKTSSLSATAGQGLRENEALQSMLSDIYIDVEVIKMDWATKSARLEGFDFEIFSDSVGAPFVDPDAYHTNIFFLFEDGSRNRTGYLPAGWKALHDKQTVLNSPAERAPILREMAAMTIKDNFMLGTVRPAVQQPHRGNWRGYTAPVLDGSNFSFEELWLAP
jgi:peptide/nickel transport system substrate-binding protein